MINEPQKCTWGDGGANDIRKMYSDIGNAILAIDPRPLIVCEGPAIWSKSSRSNFAGTHSGIFSEADLSLAQKLPVTCTVPAGAPPGTTKVCYSVHDYPAPWTMGADSGDECIAKMEACWGYLVTKDIAPVWLTELGCAPQNRAQIDHLDTLIPYMAGTSPGYVRKPCHSAWWCWHAVRLLRPAGDRLRHDHGLAEPVAAAAECQVAAAVVRLQGDVIGERAESARSS